MRKPENLLEAIEEGMRAHEEKGALNSLQEHIRDHVRDFLAQKFGVAYLTSNDLDCVVYLWKAINEK
jgi:hypothetical protein